MIPVRVVERLLNKVEPEGDCLVSLYSTGSHGYSQIGWTEEGRNKMVLGHRVAWESCHGEIPSSMTVDHICHNRRCVNVEHLRLLSNLDNSRDNGMATRTHCPVGHPYDAENTKFDGKGHRRCLTCQNERNARRYRREVR